jgi:hypothetical protein
MSIKSLFFTLSFVFVSAFSFAGSEVQPLDAPVAIVHMEAVAELTDACTMNASFSSGGSTYDVTVTATDCAGAAAGLAAIAEAIDNLQ